MVDWAAEVAHGVDSRVAAGEDSRGMAPLAAERVALGMQGGGGAKGGEGGALGGGPNGGSSGASPKCASTSQFKLPGTRGAVIRPRARERRAGP
eukprot:5754026-Prymnesium_polylepis.1